MTTAELGQRIRCLRRERGWSQAHMGWLVTPARSHAAISDLERGVTHLDIAEMTMLAEVFGISLPALLGFSEQQPPPPSRTPTPTCCTSSAGEAPTPKKASRHEQSYASGAG